MRIRFAILLSLFVVAAAIIMAIGISVRSANEVTIRSWSRCHLMQISIALHSYKQEHGCFPPAYIADKAGKRIHSWRVLLLPYLDQELLYSRYRFDKPWNNSANLSLSKPMPLPYCYPTDTDDHIDREKATANYLAVVGANTMWPGDKSTKLAAGTDDTDKILLIEITDSDIHWMEPRDLTPEQVFEIIQQKKDMGDTSGIDYVSVSGEVCTLDLNIDPESLRKLLVRDAPGQKARQQQTPSDTITPPSRPKPNQPTNPKEPNPA